MKKKNVTSKLIYQLPREFSRKFCKNSKRLKAIASCWPCREEQASKPVNQAESKTSDSKRDRGREKERQRRSLHRCNGCSRVEAQLNVHLAFITGSDFFLPSLSSLERLENPFSSFYISRLIPRGSMNGVTEEITIAFTFFLWRSGLIMATPFRDNYIRIAFL